ncbi:MAG: arginine--tRNA ligase [Coriobacteriia bacterium]|nr:arginine--tRNA ligase [Coriobacteriia bacterium]MBN2822416.1 arginine--tRNA ligase [Coriobacteriia bacterium]
MREVIESLVSQALRSAVEGGRLVLPELPDPAVERPRDPSHGDWATSVALRSAKAAGMNPRQVAQILSDEMSSHPDIDAVEIAGPGFINLRVSANALQRVLREVHERGAGFGRIDLGKGARVQVEFVSANPVGPMHVGHGRWAALGDSMARVLEHAGYSVQREFYVNDAGVQMDTFAKSVAARYLELCGREVDFGEDWYRGAYITDIAREIFDAEGDAWADVASADRESHFKETAYVQVLEHLKHVLHGMGVDFDVWFSERTLHASVDGSSEVEKTIEALRSAGHIYEKDDATWFASMPFGDDKDRVLKKADGSYTYFAADIAYHKDKFDRGFDRVIDIWGADHHGYVKRMEAAVAALGHPGKLDVVIGQLVNLFRDGEVVRMSKRTGEMVTFEDLLDEVGPDAARYFFLRRSTDQPLDFDIGLAKQQSNENPVYYVQYAHARICSILRKAAGADTSDETVDISATIASLVTDEAPLDLLASDPELALMRKLAEFPEVVEVAATQLAPAKLTRYAEDLAASFHQFYTLCRVVDPGKPELTSARLYAADATRIALAGVLALVGVGAPERM